VPGFRRFFLEGHAYHTSSVIENREPLFARPELASVVIEAIDYVRPRKAFVLAYAVMPDLMHLVVVPRGGETIASVMQSIKGFSSFRINRILGRRGSLWQRSYHDQVIRDERHLLAAIRYVEGNPVEGGLVEKAEDYPFSSSAVDLVGDYEEWLC
jgi:REP element-mobilizing transposase RayT